jgi:hypothetical protein
MSRHPFTTAARQAIASLVIARAHLREAGATADYLLSELLRPSGSAQAGLDAPDGIADVSAPAGVHLLEDLIELGVHGFHEGFEITDLRLQVRNGCLRVVHGSAPVVSGLAKSARAVRTRSGRRLSTGKKRGGKSGQ